MEYNISAKKRLLTYVMKLNISSYRIIKKKHIVIVFLFLTLMLQGQDNNNKWAIGFGAGGLLYSEGNNASVGYRFTEQFPRISIARYVFKNITLAGSFSSSINEDKKYTTLGGELRYDFGTSENLISIHVLIGGSLIDAKRLIPVLDFGVGGTLWIFERIGLNGQLIYKYNNLGTISQPSHIFASGGLVYRFNIGNGGGNVQARRRLWDFRHR